LQTGRHVSSPSMLCDPRLTWWLASKLPCESSTEPCSAQASRRSAPVTGMQVRKKQWYHLFVMAVDGA